MPNIFSRSKPGAAPQPSKPLFYMFPVNSEAELILTCNESRVVSHGGLRALGCFVDRPSTVKGRLLSFGRNPIHDIVLPTGPTGKKTSSPGNQKGVTKPTAPYQNYRSDHFFFYLAPSGELILRDNTPRLTLIEVDNLNAFEGNIYSLHGNPRQRVIPRQDKPVTITFGTKTSFKFEWARDAPDESDLVAHALALHVTGLTITPIQQDANKLKPPITHSHELRSRHTPSGGPSSGPQRHFHRYKNLGSGASAEVWKCVDLATGELWAVKEVKQNGGSDQWKRNFIREAEILKTIKHENIVHFEGWQDFCIAGKYQLIFELYDNTLEKLIADYTMELRAKQEKQEGKQIGIQLEISLSRSIARGSKPEWYPQLVKQMFAALSYLHCAGMVHRDVKPSNIMYRKPAGESVPNFYLGDFGLSADTHSLRNEQVQGRGTLFYLAPELVTPHKASADSDIWALGVVFARVLGFVIPDEMMNEEKFGPRYWKAKLGRHGFSGDYTEPSPDERNRIPQITHRMEMLARYARIPPGIAAMLNRDQGKRGAALTVVRNPSQLTRYWEYPSKSLEGTTGQEAQQTKKVPIRQRQDSSSQAESSRQAAQTPQTSKSAAQTSQSTSQAQGQHLQVPKARTRGRTGPRLPDGIVTDVLPGIRRRPEASNPPK